MMRDQRCRPDGDTGGCLPLGYWIHYAPIPN